MISKLNNSCGGHILKFSKKTFLIIFYIIDSLIIIGSLILATIENSKVTYGLDALESVAFFVLYALIFCGSSILLLLVTSIILIRRMIKKIKGIIETEGLSRKMKILFIFYFTDILLSIGSFILFMTDTRRYEIGDTVSEVRYYIYIIVFQISIILLIVVSIVLLIIWMVKKIKNKIWKE